MPLKARKMRDKLGAVEEHEAGNWVDPSAGGLPEVEEDLDAIRAERHRELTAAIRRTERALEEGDRLFTIRKRHQLASTSTHDKRR